jgi:hypothetical protein
MRLNSVVVNTLPVLSVLLLWQSSAGSQTLPLCSWPLETTGSGITNVAYPDTNATYWTMPFDSQRWKSIEITGTYPNSRFFSFVSYVATGSVVDGGSRNDVDIKPDAGSTNPFVTSEIGPHHYTVTAGRSAPNSSSNFLPLGDTQLVWIIYRIYVPDKNLGRKAGVPLPEITVTGQDGKSHTVPACPSGHNSGVVNLARDLFGQGLDAGSALFRVLSGAGVNSGRADQAACAPTPLVSWIPKNTGGYFPNPANKYIALPGICFTPGQILIVRAKGAVFPDTYNGGPVWEPPGLDMRYWSTTISVSHIPW